VGLTYYELFGVSQAATNEEIERAYRSASKAYHPDAQGPVANTALFREVTEARDTLIDPVERNKYDQALLNSSSPGSKQNRSEPYPRQREGQESRSRTSSQGTPTSTSQKMQRSKPLLVAAALTYFLSRVIIQFGGQIHSTIISFGGHQLMSLSAIPVLIFLVVPNRQVRKFFALARGWVARTTGGRSTRRPDIGQQRQRRCQ
jgi:curved DNA-binding protein CbpA